MIWLLRHCETTGQEPDAQLTAKGTRQATAIAPTLAGLGVTRIITSPYLRARASAAPLANGDTPLEEDPRLAEWQLSGSPSEDWQNMLSAAFQDPGLTYPGGETAATAMNRGLQSIHAQSGKGPCLFVSHGGLITLILSRFGRDLTLEALLNLRSPDLFVLEGATCQRIELPEAV